ncbi:MAG: NfeD family protein [bacterium]
MEPFWIGITIFLVLAFIVIGIVLAITAHKKSIESGREGLAGKIGTAKTDINPSGKFYVYGEYWNAEVLGEPLKEGDKGRIVEIRSADEQYLIVEKIN